MTTNAELVKATNNTMKRAHRSSRQSFVREYRILIRNEYSGLLVVGDAVRRRPYSVLLFDEMEKAHRGLIVLSIHKHLNVS